MTKEAQALKAAADILTVVIEAAVAAQRINSLLSMVQAEKRDLTDDEWSQLYSDTDAAMTNLRLALANK